MSNPSTIWTQLALPNPPSGSLPFVAADNATIVIDNLNYFYSGSLAAPTITSSTDSRAGASVFDSQVTVKNGVRQHYVDSSGVPGNAVANSTAGRAAFAAGTNSVTITNSYVTVTSLVDVQLETADATLNRVTVTPANGSVTITGNANATGITKFNYTVNNVY